jgi:hypothetical protein
VLIRSAGLWKPTSACEPWTVILRMLRGPETGGPSPLARLLACLLIVGLVGITAPVLIPVFRWILALL